MESWGADVVASLSCRAGGGIARWIVEAAASASAVKDHLVCAVYPTCRGGDCAEDCVAIYWLLRLIVGAPEECLFMMKKMRPVTHEEFLRTTRHMNLYSKAESVFFFEDTRCKEGVARRSY